MNNKGDYVIYCPECSKVIERKAIFCPNCRFELNKLETVNKTTTVKVEAGSTPKKKWVAIVLALFINFWAWLYTYKKSYKKFWIVFSITLVILLMSFCSMLFFDISMGGEVTESVISSWIFSGVIYLLCTELWVLIEKLVIKV